MPTPIKTFLAANFDTWKNDQPERLKAWMDANAFSGDAGASLVVPDDKGGIAEVILGLGDFPMWDIAKLPASLPKGDYKVAGRLRKDLATDLAIGWQLGSYSFDRYKPKPRTFASLETPAMADTALVDAIAGGIALTRDLVNTPAEDMGPPELEDATRALAKTFKAKCKSVVGDDLLVENFPSIHAVGRAAQKAPRLIEMTWGKKKHPKLTLVGKGVCFDTGGLGLKPAAYMRLMKKDMGGAAHVLGLAHAIMTLQLPVRLTVLIPAVENNVSGNAMRPLDIITSRQGTTIEIGHTDAEGRVILADALALACEAGPDLVIDFATLTGAARVALGTEIPALFTHDDSVADALQKASVQQRDALWRMPLWEPYRDLIKSKTAEISNDSAAPYGGAITAALFLDTFVPGHIPWAHLDVMAWNTSSRPGRPEGGEAMGLRAVLAMIKARYGAKK